MDSHEQSTLSGGSGGSNTQGGASGAPDLRYVQRLFLNVHDGVLVDTPGYGDHVHSHLWGSSYNTTGLHTHGCPDDEGFCRECAIQRGTPNLSVFENLDERYVQLHQDYTRWDQADICYCDGYLTFCPRHLREMEDQDNEILDQIMEDSDSDSDSEGFEPWIDDEPNDTITYTPVLERAECVICMNEFTAGVRITCGHAFHRACIDRWIEQSRSCPMCRGYPQMFSTFNRAMERLDVHTLPLLERSVAGASASAANLCDTVTAKVNEFDEFIKRMLIGAKDVFSKVVGSMNGIDSIFHIVSLFHLPEGTSGYVLGIWHFCKLFINNWNLLKDMLTTTRGQLSSEQEKFEDALSSFSTSQGDFFSSFVISGFMTSMLPAGFLKILEVVNKHSRIKLLSDVPIVDNIFHSILMTPSVLFRMIGDIHPKINVIMEKLVHYYEIGLSYISGTKRHFNFRKAVRLISMYTKDQQIVRSAEFIQEFNACYDFLVDDFTLEVTPESYPHGYEMVIKSLKAMKCIIEGMKKCTKAEPIWMYFVGPSQVGKTTFASRVLTAMSDYTVYSHQKVAGQKEFWDGYCNEDIMWEEDLTECEQLLKYLNLVTTHAVALDVSSAGMRGMKKFTTPLIFTTSNYDISQLIEKKYEGSVPAIRRRAFRCSFEDVLYNPTTMMYDPTRNSGDATATIRVFKYDAQIDLENLVFSFNPNEVQGGGVEAFTNFVFQELDNKRNTFVQIQQNIPKIVKRPMPQMYKHNVSPDFLTQYPNMRDYDDHMNVEERIVNHLSVTPEAEAEFVRLAKLAERGLHYPITDGGKFRYEVKESQDTISWFQYVDSMWNSMQNNIDAFCFNAQTFIDWFSRQVKDVFTLAYESVKDLSWIKTSFASGYESVGNFIGKCEEVVEVVRSDPSVLIAPVFLGCVSTIVVSSISCFIKWSYSKVVKSEEKPVYVKPASYGNVRRVNFSYGSAQAVYPGQTSVSFPTQFERIRNNMMFASFIVGSHEVSGIITAIDGQTFMCCAHFLMVDGELQNECFVYAEDQEKAQLLSGEKMSVVYADIASDFVLLKYKSHVPSVFKSIAKRFDLSQQKNKNLFLVTPDQCLPITSPSLSQYAMPYFNYKHGMISTPADSYRYEFQAPGLCGALICDEDGLVLGFHVAVDSQGMGVARPIRRSLRTTILKCDSDGIGRKLSPVSGFIVESDQYRHVPSNSVIAPSTLYETFPVTRAPAVLRGKDPDGSDILSNAVSKNLKPVGRVDVNALPFLRRVLRRVFGMKKFKSISESEVVCGKVGSFPGFDKTSSAGIPYNAKNGEVLDYENGKLGKAKHYVEEMRRAFAEDDKLSNVVVFGDTVKDELRNIEKIYKPRLFAAGPVHYAAELKRKFANLVEYLVQERFTNGIMIGLNPLGREWDKLAKKLTRKGPKIIPGDYKHWDGMMVTIFEELLNEEMASSCEDEVEYAKWLLDHLSHTMRLLFNEMLITNHSIPSGHFLTTVYNSLMNVIYNAYAFYKLIPETMCSKSNVDKMVDLFFRHFFSAKLGDDVLMNVSDEISEFFNAFSYTQVMADLGIGFTAENKLPHTKAFYLLEECTFLKRSFVFHPLLMRVVGPLDRDSMLSTISWVSDKMRMEELVDLKVGNFQREAFLHADYSSLIRKLKENYERVYGLEPELLSDEILCDMYERDVVCTEYVFDATIGVAQSRVRKWVPTKEHENDTQFRVAVDIIVYEGEKQEHVLVKGFDYEQPDGSIIRGKWGLAKGCVKRNEDVLDAAIREVNEEVGIPITRFEFYNKQEFRGMTVLKFMIPKMKFNEIVRPQSDEILDIMLTATPRRFNLNYFSKQYF